jgi:hypothetical protein
VNLPNPGKSTPDIKFVLIENKQHNPSQLGLIYNSDPPRLRSVGRINSVYEMHDLMSK